MVEGRALRGVEEEEKKKRNKAINLGFFGYTYSRHVNCERFMSNNYLWCFSRTGFKFPPSNNLKTKL